LLYKLIHLNKNILTLIGYELKFNSFLNYLIYYLFLVYNFKLTFEEFLTLFTLKIHVIREFK